MAFRVKAGPAWPKTAAYLQRMSSLNFSSILSKYGEMGRAALAAATPEDSGASAAGWYYEIESGSGGFSIRWGNSHMGGGVPVVILLQLGHGTGTGGYVQGRDFINPAIKPIFDQIEAELGRVVSR